MVATTFHPRSWNFVAAALPKPDEQPVMRTVLVMSVPSVGASNTERMRDCQDDL
jgi:hypothetical protein